MHKAGTYTDHKGAQPAHNTLDTMTIHHDTDTCCGGTCCDGLATNGGNSVNPAKSQFGRDIFVYKVTKDGAPVSVYGVDMHSVDGISNGIQNDPSRNITGGSVNGASGPFASIEAIDSFEQSGNAAHVVIAGRHRGRLSFPKADGTLLHLDNAKMIDRSIRFFGYNVSEPSP